MTDRELMQQALEALTVYDGTNGESKRKRVLTALRERLAQPEQEIDWKDQYEKQKRRAEMWRDKYEAVAGPDECVYPAQPEQEQMKHGGRPMTLRECMEAEEPARQEQEPVAYTTGHCENHKQKGGCQLHNLQCGWPDCDRKPITAPQRREWVGLTRDEVLDIEETHPLAFYRAIEAKLREKNA